MSAFIKDTMRKLLILVCTLWLRDTYGKDSDAFGDWMTFFIYPKDFDFQDDRMQGNRIQIEFQFKEWKEG